MLNSTIGQPICTNPQTPVSLHSRAARTKRIEAILGPSPEGLPRVDRRTLAQYYRFLAANLSCPFPAHYPLPTSPREKAAFRCTVLEVLDPIRDLYDDFDGIFCKTRKGKYEINLPLRELVLPGESPESQLIEDYWYWFTTYN
jgi:hypothetical protein